MKEIIEERKIKGYTIKIYQDDFSENPREWDNLGEMVCFHRRYDLGDKHNFSDSEDFMEFLKKEKPVFLPLFLYDHSGITMSTRSFHGRLPQGHAEFDSFQVGVIYATKEKIKKEYGVKTITKKIREKVLGLLESEVKTYDQFLRSEVYGFILEDPEGNNIDSCWGFFGSESIDNYMIPDYVLPSIEYDLKQRREERTKATIEETQELFI